jgi:hypothetical protein
MGQVKTGQCRLCLDEGVRLLDSHVFPKWTYRRLRPKDSDGTNPNPYRITPDRIVQTSRQVREYLLCPECESRLDVWENYVAKLAHTETRTSPLVTYLRRQNRTYRWDRKSGEYGLLDDYDTKALASFGLSLFWRASVSSQQDTRGMRLGPKYEEIVRQFLMGAITLPPSLAIMMDVVDPDHPGTSRIALVSTILPQTFREPEANCHYHTTLVCGLVFQLYVGQRLPTWARHRCLMSGEKKAACLLDGRALKIESMLQRRLADINGKP